jgi:hypothetical protein
VLLGRAVMLGALGLLTACASTQQLEPASLAGSRRLVSVTYPTPQTLRARAAGRDSILHRVTQLIGWPTAVRGDTLDLQVREWHAEGRTFAMRPPDFTVTVLPATGVAIRNHADDRISRAGTVLIILGIATVIWLLSQNPPIPISS